MMNDEAEKGFYHPDRGYWQVTLPIAPGYLEAYPHGTVEVPLRPGVAYSLEGGGWVYDLALEPAAVRGDVNAERDRRAHAGFNFADGGGVLRFDNGAGALARITGAATLAGFAMGAGAKAGNYLWHGGADPFSWILSDNQVVQVDAPTMFAIGQAAASWESHHIFAARAIKDLPEIPLDFADDSYWP